MGLRGKAKNVYREVNLIPLCSLELIPNGCPTGLQLDICIIIQISNTSILPEEKNARFYCSIKTPLEFLANSVFHIGLPQSSFTSNHLVQILLEMTQTTNYYTQYTFEIHYFVM